MIMNRSIGLVTLCLALVAPVGCAKREVPKPVEVPVVAAVPVAVIPAETTAAERQAIITDKFAKRPWSEKTRAQVVERMVAGTAGLTTVQVTSLMDGIDSSLAVIAEDLWDAAVRLTDGKSAPSGSTMTGVFITGVMTEAAGPQPIVINCGRVRATGFIEKVGERKRAAGTITTLAVQRADGSLEQYQDAKGLAYLSGPDGLDGITLEKVVDQRNNSWLGIPAGTKVLVVLSREVDSSLMTKAPAPVAP